ncbi:MAG: GNAT family N-acetyltransferase [Lactimicrobium sp.]|jgi:GNAT superfamily N-acetyltransferase|uniref:GNAT family N-acetyltransferase n=1 Tax=Lactimicrobium sp. TaxID=2563780 RepID=UPI002F360D40
MEVRQTTREDLDAVMKIYAQAKKWMKEAGNPQWQGNYPAKEDIEKDMAAHGSYVLVDDGVIVATTAILFGDDPHYRKIEGKWLNDEPYGVIHRTAVAGRGKGYGSVLIQYAQKQAMERGIFNLRMDTHEKNANMRHLMEKNGFVWCGTVWMDDGSPRMAGQKVLDAQK